MGGSSDAPDRATLTAFTAAVLIGGMNFVAVRFSNRELEPWFGAGIRFAAAGLLFLGYLAIRRIPLPRGRVLLATAVYGLLSFFITYALAYWALQRLSAGLAAVVFGATPLMTMILAAIHRLERFTMRGILAAAIALVGITILANPGSGASVAVIPLLAVLGATVAAAEATVIIKVIPPTNPVATNGVGMALGAAALLALSAIVGERWTMPQQGATRAALLYLILIGSMGLFGLFLLILSRWTASGIAYMTVLFPIVAMIGGRLFLDEAITARGLVGGAVVITAVYFGALRQRRRSEEQQAPVPE